MQDSDQGSVGTGYVTAAPSAVGVWSWPVRVRYGKLILFGLTVVLYAGGLHLALLLIEHSGFSSVFFIPAGVTIGMLLRLPPRLWWVVVVAVGITEAALDLRAGYGAGASAGFALANMAEPVIGALIVNRACGIVDLARIRHVWWYLVGAVTVGPAVGAAIGSASAHLVDLDRIGERFPQWWLGDALGVLVVGTAIVAWSSSRDRRSVISLWGMTLLASTVGLTIAVLSQPGRPMMFIVLLAIVVAGAVFGLRAVAMTGLLIASTIAIDLAISAQEAVVGNLGVDTLIRMKAQLGLFIIAGLVVAAESHETRAATERAAEARSRIAQSRRDRLIEHEIAVRLQDELLSEIPNDLPRVECAAIYLAGHESMVVGGDWYDAFALSPTEIGVTIGDVVGHGLEASALMGRLRTAVRVLASVTSSPSELLIRLDEFAGAATEAEFATATYAVLDTSSGVLRYSSAGHPPMLLLTEDSSEWLDGALSPPLHGGPVPERAEAAVQLPAGAVLLAYTDGLIERRGREIERGMATLESVARKLYRDEVGAICSRVIDEMEVVGYQTDDVALLALRYTGGQLFPTERSTTGFPAGLDGRQAEPNLDGV